MQGSGGGPGNGVASEQLERVDASALRDQLDTAYRLTREQPRPVAELCARRLPFVTPGLDVRFDGAKDSGDAYTYETDSTRPLTIRGVASPARAGTVTVRREFGSKRSFRARIGPDGRFALPTLRLVRRPAPPYQKVMISLPSAASVRMLG